MAGVMRDPRVVTALSALSAIGAAVVVLLAVEAAPRGSQLGIAAAAALLGGAVLVGLLMLPAHVLPAVALVAFALVPVNYLPGRTYTAVLSPGLVAMLVWALRTAGARGFAPGWNAAVLTWAMLLWLFWSSSGTVDMTTTIAWLIPFAGLVLIPFLVAPTADPRCSSLLIKTWIVTGAVLSGVAVVEAALKSNPLLGGVYVSGDVPLAQVWSVYRVTTTLGHPLMNGAFFAVTLALSVTALVDGGRRRLLVPASLLLLVGLALTASRAGLAAATVAVAVVVLFGILRSRIGIGAQVLLVVSAAAGVATVLNQGAFASRAESAEGIVSAIARQRAFDAGLAIAGERDFLGYGPGTSALVNTYGVIIENSPMQLLISIGLPGLLLVGAVVLTGLITAVRRDRDEAVGVLLAFTVVAAGFNLAEGARPALLMLGLGLLLARCPIDEGRLDVPTREVGDAARWRSTSK